MALSIPLPADHRHRGHTFCQLALLISPTARVAAALMADTHRPVSKIFRRWGRRLRMGTAKVPETKEIIIRENMVVVSPPLSVEASRPVSTDSTILMTMASRGRMSRVTSMAPRHTGIRKVLMVLSSRDMPMVSSTMTHCRLIMRTPRVTGEGKHRE